MLFGKKTADDVLKLFSMLSEEEQAKVLEGLKGPDTEDEAQAAEAEEHIEEKGEENGTEEQSAQDIEDESVGEQEKLDGDEDSQTAEDRIDESEGAQAYDEKNAAESAEDATEQAKEDGGDKFNEVLQALAAKVEAAEAKIASLEEALSDRVQKDNDQDFGSSPAMPSSRDDGSRMAEVMNTYAGIAAKRYL